MIISMEKLVYQMFILGVGGLSLKQALTKGLGGIILFAKDIKTEEQLTELIREVKSQALVAPFISIDQEGGRVERTETLRPRRLSAKYAFEKGEEFLKTQSNEISKELANWGFNLNFAPCIDVNSNPRNPIIGERAFSDNPDDVIKGMNIFIEESRKNNVIPCVKHYPGHGDADKDSHLTLPRINLTFDEMKKYHIKPFEEAVKNDIEMIMAAHLHCTCFDTDVIPTSLSRNAIRYLRNELNYNGVIISDDMFMKGVQDFGSLEACIMGIKAGLDMFIFRESDDKTLEMIENLVVEVEKDENLKKMVLESNSRIKRLKELYGIV